jgi:hypothetical protein
MLLTPKMKHFLLQQFGMPIAASRHQHSFRNLSITGSIDIYTSNAKLVHPRQIANPAQEAMKYQMIP